jgi:hypothetical protein
MYIAASGAGHRNSFPPRKNLSFALEKIFIAFTELLKVQLNHKDWDLAYISAKNLLKHTSVRFAQKARREKKPQFTFCCQLQPLNS